MLSFSGELVVSAASLSALRLHALLEVATGLVNTELGEQGSDALNPRHPATPYRRELRIGVPELNLIEGDLRLAIPPESS